MYVRFRIGALLANGMQLADFSMQWIFIEKFSKIIIFYTTRYKTVGYSYVRTTGMKGETADLHFCKVMSGFL